MADRADPFETWVVATFNVVLFALVLVLAGHASGVLADTLPGLGTLPGVLAFGYLWALVIAGTRWALADGGLDRIREGELPSLVVRGAVAGTLVGAGFVLGVALAAGLVALAIGGLELVSLGLVVLFGTVAGGVGGLVVGAASVLVDAALYRATDLLVPPPAS